MNHETIVTLALLANGDLPGHEFHGNQHLDAGSYGALAARADSAGAAAQTATSLAVNPDAHAEAAQAHDDAAAKNRQAANHPEATPLQQRMHARRASAHEESALRHTAATTPGIGFQRYYGTRRSLESRAPFQHG